MWNIPFLRKEKEKKKKSTLGRISTNASERSRYRGLIFPVKRKGRLLERKKRSADQHWGRQDDEGLQEKKENAEDTTISVRKKKGGEN